MDITRTCYGGQLQTCLWLRRPYAILTNTTLNEKLDIQSGVYPANNVYPALGYMAIGNGGHKLALGADGLIGTDPQQQESTNASPFKMMPFVLREETNDLTTAQQANYALRREETWNGTRYYAYYLKRIDLSNVNPTLEYITVDGDTKTVTPWVPDSSVLNPVPQALSSTGVNTTDGDYISVSAQVPVNFTADDMTELMNMSQVMFGDPKFAIVSEIALCQGTDKTVDSPAPGNTTIPFNEAIAVQVASFVPAFVVAQFSQTGFDMVLDCGTTEPLFNVSTSTTTTTSS